MSATERATGPLPGSLGSSLKLRGVEFRPALFCAPMAGLTHSAFRRLVSDFGGHGALFTEMLCGRWLRAENLAASAATRRRAPEGPVIYQLMIAEPAEVPAIMARVAQLEPAGVDLNCACPAPNVRHAGAGSALFEDRDRLAAILSAMRREFAGPLTVKIRLGLPRDGWQARLLDRLRLFEDCGVDAVTLHPRFADEKLRRRARHELFPALAAATRLPIIASGDLHGPEIVRRAAEHFAGVAGVMVGRMAVVQPWLFRAWQGEPVAPDYLEVWQRFARYVREDFPERKVFHRIKAFTAYYARNFHFGHTLLAASQSATDLGTLTKAATRFLAANPQPAPHPDVSGLA